VAQIWLSGGTAVIDDATAACLKAAAQGTAASGGVSKMPELVAAKVMSTDTTGSIIRYTFDESINDNSSPGSYHAITGGDDVFDGNDSVIVTADDKSVDVQFTDTELQSATGAASLTVATVDAGAVTDNDASPLDNPIGDAALNSASSTSLTAGKTTAPDLVSVSNIHKDPFLTTDILADFTFDQAAFDNCSTCYHVVLTDGTTDIASTSVEAGDGTTKITVRYNAATLGGAGTTSSGVTASTVGRGYVETDTVDSASTGTGNNPLEAADLAGATDSPDLVSVTLQADATSGADKVDRIIYTFDEAVTDVGVNAGDFVAYNNDGSEVTNNGDASRNPSNTKQVAVDFADGDLATAVGASVDTGGVTGFTTTNGNLPDEEAMTNSGAVSLTPGKTSDPDLILVTVVPTKDAFGNVTGGAIAFTFDENLENGSAPTGSYIVYDGDGTEYDCDAAAMPTVSNTAPNRQDTVVCGTHDGFTTFTAAIAKSLVLGTVDFDVVEPDDANSTPADGNYVNPEGGQAAILFGWS
jgi:hypothetical protein